MYSIKACNNVGEVIEFYSLCRRVLEEQGIHQRTSSYPSEALVTADMASGTLWGLYQERHCRGVITLNRVEDDQFKRLQWKDQSSQHRVIHRLAIHPERQGLGLGKQLLDFAMRKAVVIGQFNRQTQ